jgi:hypothetical protein
MLQDPFAEKTVYNDNMVDKLFIKLFTQKMADQLEGEGTRNRSGKPRLARLYTLPTVPGALQGCLFQRR